MSVARHHADWLNLVAASGPFVSLPVLMRTFPQGLEPRDPAQAKQLRNAYEEWQDHPSGPGRQRAWLLHVLTAVLGYPENQLTEGQTLPPGLEAPLPEHAETLRPDFALVGPAGTDNAGKAQLLISTYPAEQPLEKPVIGKHWKATPATRMMELLHASGVPLGVVTNGEQWMLVYAPRGETTGYASWYASLWMDEPITLRAFHSLLGARRFFGVAADATLLALIKESAQDQQEVTDQLGYQVRAAVEVLVQSFDALDRESSRALLKGVSETDLYNAALTLMMRLVFLFYAEERGLLHLGRSLYDDNYAVSTLLEQLQEVADRHGEEVLERRHDAWARLLATFRAVHGGVQHQDLLLPAYGGSLFDPDRYPFLEGRPAGSAWRSTPAEPLAVNNRVVLHLLGALQRLQVKVAGGGPAESRRLSFSALGVEQIGHVYEGLLDHTARRAEEPILGIQGTRKKEPEIPLSTLEGLLAKGQDKLIEFLKDETGRSVSALRKALDGAPLLEEHKLLIACGHDDALLARIRPFAGLIRSDSFDRPVVVLPGSVYVTAGSDRRSTGTQYTPPSFTEPVVQHTLEPLVYEGPAEGRDRAEWRLRPAQEILCLKVCDMAMGSGAFLVQTINYLAARLLEAWENAESAAAAQPPGRGGVVDKVIQNVLARPSSQKFAEKLASLPPVESSGQEASPPAPRPRVTPEGQPATGNPGETLIPLDPDERMIYAKRIIADRCIYGVDINPMAVEMAKLSLWLTTVDKGRAFTFLDHALKCGDALLGLWDVRQVHKFHLDPEAPAQGGIWGDHLKAVFDNAMAKRRELESFTVVDIRDAEHKAALLKEADDLLEAVELLCDQLLAAAVNTADGNAERRGAMLPPAFEKHRHRIFDALMAANSSQAITSAVDAIRALAAEGRTLLNSGNPNPQNPRKPFHWVLEFPEVFATGEAAPMSPLEGGSRGMFSGFHAFVGNPPFMGGQKITGNAGTDYRNYCVDVLAGGKKGSADLCAYFFLRAGQMLRPGGTFGLIATNTIAQGDTREVGLDQLAAAGHTLYRAIPSVKWPGAANLEVADVWGYHGTWAGEFVLDGKPVHGITPYLTTPGAATGKPYRLKANEGKSFIGSYVLGMGFVMSPEEAAALIEKDPRNKDVLYPYLNGEDLNSRPDQSPSRWVINFHDWPLDRSAEGNWIEMQLAAEEGNKAAAKQITAWLRDGRVPQDYPDPVAADYPDCLAIVEEKVKPERRKLIGRNSIGTRRGEIWWRYGAHAPELYTTIAGMDRVLVRSRVSNLNSWSFVQRGICYSEATVVVASSESGFFIQMQNSFQSMWIEYFASSMRTDVRYTPSDCFETFPFPDGLLEHGAPTYPELESIGERYHTLRQQIMSTRNEGLTATYNRFHNPAEKSEDIAELRRLHTEMDQAVAAAYGWDDLDLGHGFHQTKQGTRYTLSEPARREVLDRLLALNHQRYAEEVAAGLHDKGKKKKPAAKTPGTRGRKKKDKEEPQGELF